MDINKICDGYPDCPDGEDEEGCNGIAELLLAHTLISDSEIIYVVEFHILRTGCPKDHFACTDSGQKHQELHCISMFQRCDDIFDCAERDDEQNCEVLTETVNSHNV